MTGRAQALLRETLALPAEERTGEAAELLASLDEASGGGDPGEVQAAWASEVETRARRVISGESAGEPWPEVRARLPKRLSHQWYASR